MKINIIFKCKFQASSSTGFEKRSFPDASKKFMHNKENFSSVRFTHFKFLPGPAAKNATLGSLAENRTLDSSNLVQWSTNLATKTVDKRLATGSVLI